MQDLSEQNPFGGHPHGLYVPLTPDEQDAINRAVQLGLIVRIDRLGVFSVEKVTIGDHRMTVEFFVRVADPVSVTLLTHQVETSTGIVLVRDQVNCTQNGSPLLLLPGEEVQMQLHISLIGVDPEFVRQLRPGFSGLSSRRIDLHTGNLTLEGNMKNLSEKQKRLLQIMEESTS